MLNESEWIRKKYLRKFTGMEWINLFPILRYIAEFLREPM